MEIAWGWVESKGTKLKTLNFLCFDLERALNWFVLGTVTIISYEFLALAKYYFYYLLSISLSVSLLGLHHNPMRQMPFIICSLQEWKLSLEEWY